MYDRTKYPEFWTMSNIQKANADVGYYFFSPASLRFFNSRVSDEVYQGTGGIFFVTSEKKMGCRRLYTVRQFLPETANIETVGEFQQYKSGAAAKRAANWLKQTSAD